MITTEQTKGGLITETPYRDIVPDEYQNILIQIRDSMTRSYFEIGDIANAIILMNSKSGFRVTEQRIFDAVGRFCGKSGRTVRYYAETAAFYSPEVRSDYETVDFSIFVFARSLGSRWKEVLDFAQDNAGATLDYVRYIFLSDVASSIVRDSDTEESCEISHDSSSVDDADNPAKFRMIQSIQSGDGESCDNSQNLLAARRFGAITVLGNLSKYIDETIRILDRISEHDMFSKSMAIADLNAAKKHIGVISDLVNMDKLQ